MRVAKRLRPSVLFEFQKGVATATILYNEGACSYIDCSAIARRSVEIPGPGGQGSVPIEEVEIAALVPLNTEPLLLALDSGNMAIQARRGKELIGFFA